MRCFAVFLACLAHVVLAKEIPLEQFLNLDNRASLVSCRSKSDREVVWWVETTAGQANIFAATKEAFAATFSPPIAVTPIDPSAPEDGTVIEVAPPTTQPRRTEIRPLDRLRVPGGRI